MLALFRNVEASDERVPLSIERIAPEYRGECDRVLAYLVRRPPSEASHWRNVVTFHQGMMRWQDGNEDEALAIWRREPMIGLYWYNQGQIDLEQQSVELANRELNLAWQLAPQHFRARIAFALAKSHAQLGQIPDALLYYQAAASVSSSLSVEAEVAHRAAWQAAMLSEDYDHAQTLARELAEENPDDALSWIRLAQVLLAMGQPTQAISPLERALQLSNHDNEVRYLLARAFREAGDYQSSYSQLQWTEESQRDWNYYAQLALTLRAAGCTESAQEQWIIAQKLHKPLESSLARNREELECTLDGYR